MSIQHSKTIFYTLIFGSLFLLIFLILLYFNSVSAEIYFEDSTSSVVTEIAPTTSQSFTPVNEVIKEKLTARSYIIYDINEAQTLRGENINTPLPLASLTKVITVTTLLDKIKNSSTTLQDQTKLMIKKSLVSSSNEDAENLGYIYLKSFNENLVSASNQFLREKLKINDIKITNLTGLDHFDGNNLKASNLGSAESVAKVFAYVYENHREIFEYTRHESVPTEIGNLKNTNKISDSTFGLMASKTGFTFEAGGNLGVIVSPSPGQTFVILVMGSTKEGRFQDIEKLSKLLPYLVE